MKWQKFKSLEDLKKEFAVFVEKSITSTIQLSYIIGTQWQA